MKNAKIQFVLSGMFVLAGILSVINARADAVAPGFALQWDATTKSTNLPEGTPKAQFAFYFKNVAVNVEHTGASNTSDPATGAAFGSDSVTPSPITVLNYGSDIMTPSP